MISLASLAVLVLLQAPSRDLTMVYSAEKALRVERTLTLDLEQSALDVEHKGKPVDIEHNERVRFRRTIHDVHIDRVLRTDGQSAQHVQRTYSVLTLSTLSVSDAGQGDGARTSLFSGVTLDLVTGRRAALILPHERARDFRVACESHDPNLGVAALLPRRPAAEGTTWNLDSATISHGLGFDLDNVLMLFDADGAERRARRPGPRNALELPAELPWHGKARIKSLSHEYGGELCALISLDLRAQGEADLVPESDQANSKDGSVPIPPKFARGKASIELTGELEYSLAGRRPVSLSLSGRAKLEQHVQYKKNDLVSTSESSLYGTLELRVDIAEQIDPKPGEH